MKIDKRITIIGLCIIVLIISIIIGISFAVPESLTSSEYEIKNNTIYAVPTTYNFRVEEFLSKLTSSSDMIIRNNVNEILKNGDLITSGYTLTSNNTTYNIVVIGDVTSDGSIDLGDVAKLYNSYKGKATLDENETKAGDTTSDNKINLGDVSKLYNYFKGKTPFSYYNQNMIDVDDLVEKADTYYDSHKTSNLLGTNLIDKVTTSHSSSDKLVITKNGGVEASILKDDKCYRKSALSNYVDVLEGKLCNADIDGFASNNGRLHVTGTKIYNEYNKEIRLNGVSGGNLGRPDTSTSLTSLETLHNWGANAFRFFINMESTNPYAGPACVSEVDECINGLKEVIDNAIANDLYINVVLSGNGDKGMYYSENAIDLFTRIATLYPDDPHIIYEIWNEPEKTNTWAEIKEYAEKVIPPIRAISPNAIILVGTPSFDSDITSVIGNELDFSNVMYTHHTYMNVFGGNTLTNLETALNAGIPVFESEWGPASVERNGEALIEVLASTYVEVLKKYNLSNFMFVFAGATGNGDLRFCITQKGDWDDKLPDSVLTENGKFMKNTLSNNYVPSSHMLAMNNGEHEDEGITYRSSEYKNLITSIEFRNKLDNISNATVTWDLSIAHNNTIKGYLVKNDNENAYKLIICADGYINAPTDSKYLFAYMSNLKSINFNNFKTEYMYTMSAMFNNDYALETLNLSGFNTDKLSQMWNTFANCTSLTSIDFTGWHPNLIGISSAFYNCNNLISVDLSNLNVDEVTSLKSLFMRCNSLKTVDISTWNPTSLTGIDNMFDGCTSLESVDMRSLSISDETTITNSLHNVKDNALFKVKNQFIINKLNSFDNVNFQITN